VYVYEITSRLGKHLLTSGEHALSKVWETFRWCSQASGKHLWVHARLHLFVLMHTMVVMHTRHSCLGSPVCKHLMIVTWMFIAWGIQFLSWDTAVELILDTWFACLLASHTVNVQHCTETDANIAPMCTWWFKIKYPHTKMAIYVYVVE